MKYTTELVIDLPRERVIELFDNPENVPKWQDDLVWVEPFEGERGMPGAKTRMVYKMGRGEIEMIETVLTRKLPDEYHGTYEAKGIWNYIENHFSETNDGKTIWRVETELRCSGLIRIVGFFMPGIFKKQTRKVMNDFRVFAENQES